jgi:simple sugar transport system ATP-binding protein
VGENLALGGRGLLRHDAMTTVVHDVAAATGFALDPSALVETLSVGAQQRVEIAKALVRRARVLILDEPTAVLAPAEAEELLRWTRRFADEGHAVVLITHKLNEALAIADRVTVLRRGRVVYTGAAAESTTRTLTTAMIGEEPAVGGDAPAATDHASAAGGRGSARRVVLAARNISMHGTRGRPRLRDVTLEVHAGEIVGVAGVEGAGQWELLRALSGRLPVQAGRIERPPQVGFVPEDRHRDAVLLDRSLTDNVALRAAGERRGRMPWRELRARTHLLLREYDVRAPSPDSPMRSLSGGNQQKLVVAREMTIATVDEPPAAGGGPAGRAIVVENPTRGLDVRATAAVHARLRAARDEGAGILLYSSDLDEVLAMADRVAVLHDGALRDVPADRDQVGRALLGLA